MIARNNEVLPAPFLPITHKVSPSLSSTLISRRTWTSP